MRLLAVLLAMLVVGGAALLLVAAVSTLSRQRRVRAIESARWRATHFSREGRTHVVVVRAIAGTDEPPLDTRTVATIPDDDSDYDRKFLDAMITARERAEVLNLES